MPCVYYTPEELARRRAWEREEAAHKRRAEYELQKEEVNRAKIATNEHRDPVENETLVSMLCLTLKALDYSCGVDGLPKDIQNWWKAHLEEDVKILAGIKTDPSYIEKVKLRVEENKEKDVAEDEAKEEREKEALQKAKEVALAKLSKEDRDALNIKG